MESSLSDLQAVTKGRWEWRSNSDPWLKTEEPKWEPYSLEHNYLIEKAYYDQQKEVDLGDYLVYPLDMLQRKKGNLKAQRPVRRVDWMNDEEMNDRSARYFETEMPKTINRIFGSLGDFLSFFARRNPEILEFTSQFKEFEQSNDLDILNSKIIPKLVGCFEEGLLKPNLEQLQDPSLSSLKKKVLLRVREKIQDLILLFKKEFKSVEEFYGQILRAYTMDTDLYPNLNRYLRNESWHEVDKLLPYAFCLCKAFFNIRLKEDLARGDLREELKTSSSVILYRGTAFDEYAISLYDKKVVEYFSWNAVTSTSTNKNVAEAFMYKSVDLKNKKYPVMFIIEVPVGTDPIESEYLKWIDIHQYSAIPKEDEVVLAPGSVFELQEVSTDQDKKTTIRIKLRDEIKSLAYGGMIMQGALQSQLMTEKEAKIVCFEGEELYQALMSLHGNTLVEEVEFSLCVFDRKSMLTMIEILPTMKRVKTLKLLSCMSQDNREISIEKPKEITSCGIAKIEILGADHLFQLVCHEELNQEYWVFVKELDLHFNNVENPKVKSLVSQGAQCLTQLKSLNMTFEWGNVHPREGLNDDRGLIFRRRSPYKSQQPQINEKPFAFVPESFERKMTANSYESEQNLLVQHLSSLACSTSEKSKSRRNNGGFIIEIQDISSKAHYLTSLALNFDYRDIKDEGIENLASRGLKNLVYLTSLELSFRDCIHITDQGVDSLALQGLKHLVNLTSLNLSFIQCEGITSKGLKSLSIQGLQYLTQLTSFDLNLVLCEQITDDGIDSLAFYGLRKLNQLRRLMMNFAFCDKVTDKGIVRLASQGLRHLTQLRVLKSSFLGCKEITDDGIDGLARCGLKNMSQLKQLDLEFSGCNQITDRGIDSLASKGLKYLTQLEILRLRCPNITDMGLNNLILHGIKNLSHMTSLTLHFPYSDKVSNFSIDNIVKVLCYFGYESRYW